MYIKNKLFWKEHNLQINNNDNIKISQIFNRIQKTETTSTTQPLAKNSQPNQDTTTTTILHQQSLLCTTTPESSIINTNETSTTDLSLNIPEEIWLHILQYISKDKKFLHLFSTDSTTKPTFKYNKYYPDGVYFVETPFLPNAIHELRQVNTLLKSIIEKNIMIWVPSLNFENIFSLSTNIISKIINNIINKYTIDYFHNAVFFDDKNKDKLNTFIKQIKTINKKTPFKIQELNISHSFSDLKIFTELLSMDLIYRFHNISFNNSLSLCSEDNKNKFHCENLFLNISNKTMTISFSDITNPDVSDITKFFHCPDWKIIINISRNITSDNINSIEQFIKSIPENIHNLIHELKFENINHDFKISNNFENLTQFTCENVKAKLQFTGSLPQLNTISIKTLYNSGYIVIEDIKKQCPNLYQYSIYQLLPNTILPSFFNTSITSFISNNYYSSIQAIQGTNLISIEAPVPASDAKITYSGEYFPKLENLSLHTGGYESILSLTNLFSNLKSLKCSVNLEAKLILSGKFPCLTSLNIEIIDTKNTSALSGSFQSLVSLNISSSENITILIKGKCPKLETAEQNIQNSNYPQIIEISGDFPELKTIITENTNTYTTTTIRFVN